MSLIHVALAATIAGLAVASFSSINVMTGVVVVAVSLTAALTFRRHCFLLLFLFLAFFFLAHLRYPGLLVFSEDVTTVDQLARRVTAAGVVTDIRQLSDGRSRVDLLVAEVRDKQQTLPLARPLRVRLNIEEGVTGILPGDRIRFAGRLRQPRPFATPGEFNWPRYLASQNIDMTSWVRGMEQIEVVASSQRIPARRIVGWRIRVATAIDATVPQQRAPLVRALVLGEGQQLPDAVRKLLAAAGVSHLFAISGLHLGLLAVFGYQLLLVFYRRSIFLLNWQPPQRVLPLLLVPLLFAYLLFTGDAVSTRRAFALACIAALLLLWRYPVNPLHLLGCVALISLLVNPLLLWQASWQLSYSGAAGILLWRPVWQDSFKNLPQPGPVRYLMQVLLVTCAATIATLPWVLFNFHLIAPASVFANLICVPAVTLVVLPLGFAGLALFSVFPQVAILLFQLCGLLLEWLVLLSAAITELPALDARYLFLSRWQHLAVALMILPLLLFPQLKRSALISLTIVCCLAAPVLWQLPPARSAPVTLTMLSVGQSESLLLQNSAGQNLLIDGGGLFSERFDVGERLLAPAFGELGIRHLDAILLTHNHADHWKGLVFVLDHFPVGELWIGGVLADCPPQLRAVVEKRQVVTRVIDPGWNVMDGWRMGVLSVYNGRHTALNENDASLVLHLQKRSDHGILLTGDLEVAGVRNLLAAGIPGDVSLLKLPHHGGRNSNTDLLVTQLRPELAMVSVGYQNLYRLPAGQVMTHLEQSGISLFRTDEDGTIRAELTDSGWRVRRWRHGLFR